MPKKQKIEVVGVYNRGGRLRVSVGSEADGTYRLITVGDWSPSAAVLWSQKRILVNQEMAAGVLRWQDYFTPKQWGSTDSDAAQRGSTWGDCAEMLLAEQAAGKRQSMDVLRSRLKKWSKLDGRRMIHLKPHELRMAFIDGGAHGMAPNSQRSVISAASKVLTLAKKNGLFASDLQAFHVLMEKLSEMVPARPRGAKPKLSPEQMERVLTAIKDGYLPVYGDWFEFLFFSGLRPSEARELRWTDVDFTAGAITVSRARYGHYEVSTPKTSSGHRVVRLLPRAREALLRRREAAGGMDTLVFREPSTDGCMDYHRDRSGVTTVWYEALESCGLPRMRPYTTRHTYATNLHNAGLEDRLLARQLGHANTDVLHQVYSEFRDQPGDWGQIDRAAQRIPEPTI